MDLELLSSLAVFYFMIYSAVFWLLVYFERGNRLFDDPKPKRKPMVSIIIPVYNEEKTIEGTIRSALDLNYPNKEIIVVNDGSTDNTRKIAEKFAKKGLIKLINQSNSGKGSALNRGLKVAKGELVMCLDADSYIDKDALNHMVGYFEDPKVAAVASTMKVRTRKNFLQKIQWAEYVLSIYLRKIMSLINVLYVIPGPGGLYRKSILMRLGGFDERSTAEDMEIAFRLHKAGYKIENSLNAIVYSECPNTLTSLIRQRIRWNHGFIYSVSKHKDMFMNKKYSTFGVYILPTTALWIGVLLYSLFLISKNFLKNMYDSLMNYFMVGFDWDVFMKGLQESFKINFDVLSGFLFISLIFVIYIYYLSLKLSKEKISVLSNVFSFVLFFFFYTFLAGIFWISTLAFTFVKKDVSWRGDNLEPLS